MARLEGPQDRMGALCLSFSPCAICEQNGYLTAPAHPFFLPLKY
jgi:hypothetical protein